MILKIEKLKRGDFENVQNKLKDKNLSLEKIKAFCFSNEYKYGIIARKLEKDEIVGIATFEKLDWDTKHFGINIGRINKIITWAEKYEMNLSIVDNMLKFINKKSINDKIACIYCRADMNNFSFIHSLESNYFKLIDVLTVFSFDFKKKKALKVWNREKNSLHDDINIRSWKKKDLNVLRNIAGKSFIYDRFHSDPKFSKKKSDELHEKWIENCCNGLTDEVLVVTSDGAPHGFITCKVKKNKGFIDLVAVSEDKQKRGIGTILVNSALEWFKNEVEIVEVGTQNRNIPAMKLYIKVGFEPVSSKLTFHRWLK